MYSVFFDCGKRIAVERRGAVLKEKNRWQSRGRKRERQSRWKPKALPRAAKRLSTTSAPDKFLGLEDRRGRKEDVKRREWGRGGCAALSIDFEILVVGLVSFVFVNWLCPLMQIKLVQSTHKSSPNLSTTSPSLLITTRQGGNKRQETIIAWQAFRHWGSKFRLSDSSDSQGSWIDSF